MGTQSTWGMGPLNVTTNNMTFSKFVQIGAVVYINSGRYKGKLATIVNIVDATRVLIDGPSGVPREVIGMKQIQLTKFTVKVSVGARTGTVKKAYDAAKINELFAETAWAKSVANKAKRASLSDFERFKLRQLKKKRNMLINREVAKMAKAQ